MPARWSADSVLALAPDDSSRRAAGGLAGSAPWSGTGTAGELVWGLCAGSGKNPYQTVVDLSGPAYRCSCPSRKFPCKHALGLLLLWAGGGVPEERQPADYARAWLETRRDKAEKSASRTIAADSRAATARRADERAARVAAGLAELQEWLRDQVRAGFATAASRPGTAGHAEAIAARMVDAQAPGIAGVLRGLSALPASAGDEWPARLLGEYARLHLLARAHERLGALPPGLAAVVRSRVGYTTGRQEVLARPAVTDHWLVIAVRDLIDGTVPGRRIWLRGREPRGREPRGRRNRTAGREPRCFRAERRALARRHPHLLPFHGRPGDAAGRHRPAELAPAAARAGDARMCRARRAPGRDAAQPEQDHARNHEGDGPAGGRPRGRRRRAADRSSNAGGGVRRPKARDIDWNRTIAANLSRYVPSHRTVIPERLVGYGRRQQIMARDVVLAIDQSGSMASSVVYASVFGAVLASLRAPRTSLVAFDTAVADLTPLLADPVDVLFGAQLGGGTDINQAVGYCQGLITRPRDTIFVLISDLYEGGDEASMLSRLGSLRAAGVSVVALLALSDDGAPSYDASNAASLASLGIPAFACTPDAFPELLALAIDGGDIAAWAHRNDLAAR